MDALPAQGALVRMARTRARPPALPRARSVTITRARLVALSVVIPICHVASLDARAQQVAHDASTAPAARSGAELYRDACAACHGVDGTGQPRSVVGFDLPLPDFTDCSFATREPDADWFAVVHEGGGVRGFHRMMPAFGEALTDEEIQRTLDYIRTLCEEADEWPRGELNLPRALVTEKAYPEDEAVFTATVGVDDPGIVLGEFVFEKRFGPRSQVEVSVPFGAAEERGGGWDGGLGDVAVGLKHVLFHSLASGTILSIAGEVILPTGDDALSGGTTVFEPFVAIGQLLPADAFLQFQGGVGLPFDTDEAENEAFWRGVVGKSFTEGRWGRVWSPMLEVLGERELVSGATSRWDLLPQIQVTLNRRQHVMVAFGVRVPLNDREFRRTAFMAYLLWDWFDGPFFEGW